MTSFRILALFLALTGCATSPSDDRAIEVAPGIVFTLPTPAELGRSVEATQLVTADYPGGTLVFEVRVSLTPTRLALTSTDTLGQRLLTLTWDGHTVRVSERASWLPSHIRGENILADVLLVATPEAALQSHLTGAMVVAGVGYSEIRTTAGPAIRVAREGDNWSGHARLDNLSRTYSLDVQSVEVLP